MVATMAPNTNKPGKGRPMGRRPSTSIQARVPPAIADQLAKLAERNRRTRNQELIIALEKHLKDEDAKKKDE